MINNDKKLDKVEEILIIKKRYNNGKIVEKEENI